MNVGDYFERRRSQSLSYKKTDTNRNIVKYGKCHQLLAVLIVGINTPHTTNTERWSNVVLMSAHPTLKQHWTRSFRVFGYTCFT